MDLFVLDTPLQLLNALEARHHFADAETDIVLLHWPAWPEDSFQCLLRHQKWNSVTWVSMNADRPTQSYGLIGSRASQRLNEYKWIFEQYRRRRRVDRALAKFGAVDKLVVGNLQNGYMLHACARVAHNELIAVDDGTDTLRVARRRRNPPGNEKRLTGGAIQEIKDAIHNRYISWSSEEPEKVNFFTAYDVSVGPNDTLIRNNYAWLRRRASRPLQSKDIYFLGQPLIEDGYLEESTYLEYMGRVVRYYGRVPIVYIPHKRESIRTLRLVADRQGLVIKRFTRPIEVELALGEGLPNQLGSFFCSALENCSILFEDRLQITSFYLPVHAQLFEDSPSEDIYTYFRSRETDSFRVIAI